MKITIQHYDEEVSLSIKQDDLTTTEILDKIRGLLVACGYNESNIIESFDELYQEHGFKLHPSKSANDKFKSDVEKLKALLK